MINIYGKKETYWQIKIKMCNEIINDDDHFYTWRQDMIITQLYITKTEENTLVMYSPQHAKKERNHNKY